MVRLAGVVGVLVGILTCMSVHLDVVMVHSMRTPASISFWEKMLPSVQVIPETIKTSVSPVEGTATADEFAAIVRDAMSFPALSAKFCEVAGLVCDEDIVIHSYTIKTNASTTVALPMGGHNMMTHASAASRAMGITTINDFQLDFFLEENLVEGAYMHLADNLFDPIPLRAFLPSAVAKVLPALTTANLPKLLAAFAIGKNTRMAAMMATAAYLCESLALPGEQRACPTSVEEMAAFVASEVGEKVEVLSTRGAPTSAPTTTEKKAPVKVLSYKKRSLGEGKNIVVCHNLMFPSQLYYCHHVTGTKVVQASLGASDGSVIHGVAICHMDTTLWASEHPAFSALNIPRGAEACHWNTQNDLIWIPTSISATI
ncbi:hypothetical protein BDL97_01G048300 [Sphagnum fallax]|nr:hypothetical protein BDL97_01G048300 [Sphagnum fallax]